MEDRYELRGKIGQGGIGSVHRAYDHKMKREVAIKRILTSNEDTNLEEEATKQLMAEVSALASLQHPHIVTVYDVGSDEQGPYIVMELINGKTLDEIVEQAPLIWHDFKILAMQSLEALIAAQELNMIHSDLKPPNIMLTWLPSGAFQVKIVDFGLAVLIQNQSQEEIEKLEAVYGSIFFMPPEQYERKALDTRSDLYSLGCCFYQALAGVYPFNGTTGMEVMQAHLNHSVTPIQEIRSDIPLWACHWLMWLINRYPDDRPLSAREALANFLQNDKETSPIMSRGGASAKNARLIIPSSSPSPTTGPVPTSRTTSHVLIATAPQTSELLDKQSETSPTLKHEGTAGQRKPLAKPLKISLTLAAVLIAGALVWLLAQKFKSMEQVNAYQRVASMAVRDNVKNVQVNEPQLRTVMNYIVNSKPDAYLSPAYAALAKAKATDSADFDTLIADFATTAQVPSQTRLKLFTEVIAKRSSPAAVPSILKFCAKAKNATEAVAAFNAVRSLIREEHAEELVAIIGSNADSSLRSAVAAEMRAIIRQTENREEIADILTTANEKAEKPSARKALSRLLELCNKDT